MLKGVKRKLNDLQEWMDRLGDLGVVDQGPHIDAAIESIGESIDDLIEYHRGLVEKAENERIR